MKIKQVTFLLMSLLVYSNCQGASASKSEVHSEINISNLPRVASDVDTKAKISYASDAHAKAQVRLLEFVKDAKQTGRGSSSSGSQSATKSPLAAWLIAENKEKIDTKLSESCESEDLKRKKSTLRAALPGMDKNLLGIVHEYLYKRSYVKVLVGTRFEDCVKSFKKNEYSSSLLMLFKKYIGLVKSVLQLSDGLFALHFDNRVEIGSIDSEGIYILIEKINLPICCRNSKMYFVCGRLVLCASNSIYVLNANYLNARLGEEKLNILNGHTGLVCSVLELKGGSLASCSRDGTICIWDINQSKVLDTLTCGANSSVDNHAIQLVDGKLVSYCGRAISMWAINTQGKYERVGVGYFDQHINHVTQLSDGRLAVCLPNRIQIWDLKGLITSLNSLNNIVKNLEYVTIFKFDVPCSKILELKDRKLCLGFDDGTIRILDLTRDKNQESVDILAGHTSRINCIKQLADGMFASISVNGAVCIWDLRRPKGDDPNKDQRCVVADLDYYNFYTNMDKTIIQSKDGRLFSGRSLACWDEVGKIDRTRLDLLDGDVPTTVSLPIIPALKAAPTQSPYDKILTCLARLLVVGLGITKENMKMK